MSKNLILLQDGFPGSTVSGTEVTSLNIKNFFKFEKSISGSSYTRRFGYYYYGASDGCQDWFMKANCYNNEYYQNITGELNPNNIFLNYSIYPMLFALRMKKGYMASDILITSRLTSEHLKLKFLDIGVTVDDFKALQTPRVANSSWDHAIFPHVFTDETLNIASVNNKNHCFFAFLYSTSAYELDSGTALLDNEPLFNISWTETSIQEN